MTRESSTGKTGLGADIEKIRGILEWFDAEEEVDVEKGLEKVKEGADLIVRAKKRLTELENEFTEVKKKLDNEG